MKNSASHNLKKKLFYSEKKTLVSKPKGYNWRHFMFLCSVKKIHVDRYSLETLYLCVCLCKYTDSDRYPTK